MVFKLVRVDSEESCKIQLPTGKHLIGRGKLLSCDDKRISRNHGELEVSHDAVIVKALHQNPCYIRKKETEDIQLLKLNCTTNIDSGDRFGLLPDSYWFELMHCFAGDFDKEITSNIPESNVDACSTQTEATESYQNENELQDISSNLNESIANQSINSPSILSTENKDEPETNNDDQSKSSDPKSPLKRTYSSSDDSADDVKKIKTEDVKIKLEPDVGEETDDEEKPSNDEPKPSNSSADKNTASPSSAQNPHGRERCMYGANCYRMPSSPNITNAQVMEGRLSEAPLSQATGPRHGVPQGTQALNCPRNDVASRLNPIGDMASETIGQWRQLGPDVLVPQPALPNAHPSWPRIAVPILYSGGRIADACCHLTPTVITAERVPLEQPPTSAAFSSSQPHPSKRRHVAMSHTDTNGQTANFIPDVIDVTSILLKRRKLVRPDIISVKEKEKYYERIINQSLITAVKERTVVWNRCLDIYRDKIAKIAAWREVCQIFKKDFLQMEPKDRQAFGMYVIKRWTQLKEAWVQSLQHNNSMICGSGTNFCPPFKYDKELPFLKSFVQSGDTQYITKDRNSIVGPDAGWSEGTALQPPYRNIPVQHEINARMLHLADSNLKRTVEENNYRNLNFFKSILPSLQLLDEDQILEFQSGVIQIIQSIRRKNLDRSRNHNNPLLCVQCRQLQPPQS